MAFHYIRKYGSEGTLQRIDGLGSEGLSLRRFNLHHDLPLRVSLEIIVFLADMVSDAMKNGFVHGDIKSENINILQDGSIILNGYGRPRRQTIAPEGVLSIPGDVYSLGILMLELFSGQQNIELPLEEMMHNQKVLKVFLSIDWREWELETWLPTMQEYLISLLFFEASSRPHPLDVANILSEALMATKPPNLPEFILRNNVQIHDPKEQLAAASTLRNSLMTPVEVVADSSQGVVTGFWSKDKIAQMFQQDVEEDEALQEEWQPPNQSTPPQKTTPEPPRFEQAPQPPPQQNQFNQQQRTAPPYNHEQNLPIQEEKTTSPPPSLQDPYQNPGHDFQQQNHQSSSGRGTQSQPPQNQNQQPFGQQNRNQFNQPNQIQRDHFSEPEVTAPPMIPGEIPSLSNFNQRNEPPPPRQVRQPEPPRQQVQPPQQPAFSIGAGQQSTAPPVPQIQNQNAPQFSTGQQPQQQQQQQPQYGQQQKNQAVNQPYNPTANSAVQSSSNKKLFIIIGLVSAFLILVIAIAIVALLMNNNDSSSKEDLAVEETRKIIEPVDDQNDTAEEVIPVKKEVVKPKPKAKTTIKRTPKPKVIAKPKPKLAPTIVSSADFQVQIKFRGQKGMVSCGDGQKKDFAEMIMMKFKTAQSCRIENEDGARGVITARKEGSINCKLDASEEKILCK